MGGRGASSGMSVKGKLYGTEYRSLLTVGNIKFIKKNDGNVTAPLETMTKGRVYVTLNNDNKWPVCKSGRLFITVGYFIVSGIFIPKNRKRRLYDKNKYTALWWQRSKLGC